MSHFLGAREPRPQRSTAGRTATLTRFSSFPVVHHVPKVRFSHFCIISPFSDQLLVRCSVSSPGSRLASCQEGSKPRNSSFALHRRSAPPIISIWPWLILLFPLSLLEGRSRRVEYVNTRRRTSTPGAAAADDVLDVAPFDGGRSEMGE